jgi:hypothetical protein
MVMDPIAGQMTTPMMAPMPRIHEVMMVAVPESPLSALPVEAHTAQKPRTITHFCVFVLRGSFAAQGVGGALF